MVRMQGLWMAGELRPVYPPWIHWSGGDKGLMCGSNETPRTGRGGGLDGCAWLGRPLSGLLGEIDSTELHAILTPGGVGCLFCVGGHAEIH